MEPELTFLKASENFRAFLACHYDVHLMLSADIELIGFFG